MVVQHAFSWHFTLFLGKFWSIASVLFFRVNFLSVQFFTTTMGFCSKWSYCYKTVHNLPNQSKWSKTRNFWVKLVLETLCTLPYKGSYKALFQVQSLGISASSAPRSGFIRSPTLLVATLPWRLRRGCRMGSDWDFVSYRSWTDVHIIRLSAFSTWLIWL